VIAVRKVNHYEVNHSAASSHMLTSDTSTETFIYLCSLELVSFFRITPGISVGDGEAGGHEPPTFGKKILRAIIM